MMRTAVILQTSTDSKSFLVQLLVKLYEHCFDSRENIKDKLKVAGQARVPAFCL